MDKDKFDQLGLRDLPASQENKESKGNQYAVVGKDSKEERHNRGCTIALILAFITAVPVVLCGILTATFLYMSSIAGESPEDFFNSNLDRPGYHQDKDYIDPESDPNLESILEESEENFTFKFNSGVSANSYLYEREFILANIQKDYEELGRKFGYELDYKVIISFTDSQEQYEKSFGRSYNYDLGYAGFTTYGEIQLFVNPNGEYDRQDFKRLIAHELVHIYQFDNDSFVFSGTPTWFYEGSAEYFSDSPAYSLLTYKTATQIQTLEELDHAFASSDSDEGLSAYLVANHFIQYLADEYGEESVLEMINNGDYQDFETLFIDLYNRTPEKAFEEWIATTR